MGRTDFLIAAAATVLILSATAVSCGDPVPPTFDGDRAYGYLERQVAFGPRVPGTAAHREARDWLVATLSEHTPLVTVQTFTGEIGGEEYELSNIVASIHPDVSRRVLLCAHWDCRPWADRDPDPARHDDPVPGANDGASGVAVILEIAALIAESDPPVGVDIAFFDGEDGGDYGDMQTWCLGSQHFARVMPASFRPEYALLLDLVGDRDLELTPEMHSQRAAPMLWKRAMAQAERLGIPVSDEPKRIMDDHVPLIERGIPAVDLIDFDYPAWHTVADTPDQCSPDSLARIGALVLALLYGA